MLAAVAHGLHWLKLRGLCSWLVCWLAGGLLLAACQPAALATPPARPMTTDSGPPAASLPTMQPPTPGRTTAAPESSLPAPTLTPQATESFSSESPTLASRTQYTLTVALDWPQRSAAVTESIHYTNRTGTPLTELLLLIPPERKPHVFQLEQVVGEAGLALLEPVLEDGVLRLPLQEPLGTGEAVRLSLAYRLNLRAAAGPLGDTGRQVNLGDWYAFFPPYQPDTGWVVHEPAPVGETLAYELSDFEVEIRVTGAPEGLVAAASAPEEPAPDEASNADPDTLSFRYRMEAARSFAWSASPEYRVFTASAGEVEVRAYAFREHARAGQAAAETAAQAVELYSRLFGRYPQASLAAVEADFFDGMEYDGLYFLGREYYEVYENERRSPRTLLVALTAHETAHQWWYGRVGNDPALEPWLDEGLCVYSERLFYEHTHRSDLVWWWNYRVDYFAPQGQVDSTVYDHPDFRSYVNAVYLQGANFLERLRVRLGEEAFFALLNEYYNRGSARSLADGGYLSGQAEFFSALEAVSPADISDLREMYFRQE